MSNLTRYPLQDNFETSLSQSWDGNVGSMHVNSVPDFTFPDGVLTYVVVNPKQSNMQVALIDGYNAEDQTLNVVSVVVHSGAGVLYTPTGHQNGSIIRISDSYQFWEDIATAVNTKLDNDGGNVTTGDFTLDVSGGILTFADSDNAAVTLSDLTSGAGTDHKVLNTVADTTAGYLTPKVNARNGLSKSIGSPGGNETLILDVDTSDTSVFVTTSSGSGDSGKIPALNSSGKLAAGFLTNVVKFGGTGADGALVITSATTTINVGGANVFVLNYTSISITGTGKLAFSNPASNGTIVILKSQGDVTLTSSSAPMIDMSAMGAAGGLGGTATANSNVVGSVGTAGYHSSLILGAGLGGTNSNSSTAAGVVSLLTLVNFQTDLLKYPQAYAGAGSGGGRAQEGSGSGTAVGGTGGRGGGGLIIECAGAWNFTTTNGISVAGGLGTDGNIFSGTRDVAQAGAGGPGGYFLALYNILTANTGTVNISGGAPGTGHIVAGAGTITNGSPSTGSNSANAAVVGNGAAVNTVATSPTGQSGYQKIALNTMYA